MSALQLVSTLPGFDGRLVSISACQLARVFTDLLKAA
jgi:hypothetical protein